MLLRQLIDKTTSTYTYILADTDNGDALIIDPVLEQNQRDLQAIKELGLNLKTILETHIHADHITGADSLRKETGAKCAVSASSGAENADLLLNDGDILQFGKHSLEVRATPGHTAGCVTYVLDAQVMAFTGDTLMIRGCGRTDFQQGSPEELYASVRGKIFSLPDTCLIYPGHDYQGRTVSTVAEEKAHNPRLGKDIPLETFITIMQELDLAYPAKIDVALPANMRCGAATDLE